MRLSGITIIKDGITYDYPFVEAIRSALPIVDEFVVVVGKSSDGTREKVRRSILPRSVSSIRFGTNSCEWVARS